MLHVAQRELATNLRTESTTTQSTRSTDASEPLGPASVALTMLTVALWGGTPVAISYSVDTLPPFAVAGLRFTLAMLFMIFWCWCEGTELRLRNGQIVPVFVAGVLLFLQIGTFTAGVAESSSSHATLLINTFVFWVAAIEHFVTKTDRLTLRKVAGLSIAGGGVVLILVMSQGSRESSQADTATLRGDMLLMASAVLLGILLVNRTSGISSGR